MRPGFGALPRYATVVSTRRPPLMASQRVIDARELSVAPRRRSADDLLRMVPGVLLSQHGAEGKGQQLFLRGFDAAHGTDVEVLVAGIPVNELSNIHGQGYLDLNFMIPEVVRQISVSKGPFQIQQGNFANAGTIRFELGVEANARGTRVGYELGSTIRHRGVIVHAPSSLGRDSFLALEAMRDQGFAPGRQAQRVSSLNQIRLVNSPTYGTLDLLGSGYYATFGSPGALAASDVAAGRVPFDGVYQSDGGGSSLRALTSVRHQVSLGRGRLDQRLYGQFRHFDMLENFTGDLQDAVHGDRRSQMHRFFSAGYQVEYTRPLVDTLTLAVGGAWQGDSISQSDARVDGWLVARAWAHPGHSAGGEVTGELAGDLVFDWLAQDGAALGTADVLVGAYEGMNFTFRAATVADGLAADDPLLGHTAQLAGVARKGESEVAFTAIVDIDAGAQLVGAPFEGTVDAGTTAPIELRFLPTDPITGTSLFDGLDFAALDALDTNTDGLAEISPGDVAHNILRRTLQSHVHYDATPK